MFRMPRILPAPGCQCRPLEDSEIETRCRRIAGGAERGRRPIGLPELSHAKNAISLTQPGRPSQIKRFDYPIHDIPSSVSFELRTAADNSPMLCFSCHCNSRDRIPAATVSQR